METVSERDGEEKSEDIRRVLDPLMELFIYLFLINALIMKIIGIDVGGTKIAVASVSNGKIERIVSVRTKANASNANEVIGQITLLLDSLVDNTISAVGIGVPAILDIKKGIVFEAVNIPSWKNIPLKRILEQKYKLPVLVNNDANCFALGEKYFGLGKKVDNFTAVIIGTGFGAGIIINGRLYVGQNGGAGEYGEILFKDHTVEYYCSGQYFVKEWGITGEKLGQLAKQDDKKSLTILKEFGFNLGKALSIIVHSIDHKLFILGGSVTQLYPFFEETMKSSLQEAIYSQSYSQLRIKLSKTKNVGVLGAAALHFVKNNVD